MSQNPTEYGRAIKREVANVILEKYNGIISEATSRLSPLISKDPELAKAKNLLFSGYNGFIFSRELIERFFNNSDESKQAKYLVVLLGAHPKDDGDFKEGEPTVVVVGCNQLEKEGKVMFKSVGLPEPADEHPPHTFFSELPLERSGPIILTLER